jgi:dolichol-phosphate mannosyltransferase
MDRFIEKGMELTVILPTYNERQNIVDLIQEILEAIGSCPIQPRVIVVDDNSPDGTAGLVREAFSSLEAVDVLVRTKERGLATAIARGIDAAETEIVAVMDTDFNHSPRDLARLLEHIEDHDIVINSRYARGGGMRTSRVRYLGSWPLNLFSAWPWAARSRII